MINSHKEFVVEIKNFATKMELIKDFKYLKDVDRLTEELVKSEPRVFMLGLQGINFDDSEYNSLVTYKFVVSDSCRYEDNAILNSETENMFILSSLKDYLNYLADAEIEIIDADFTTESDGESTYTSLVGSFTMLIKRSPSYWKKMEEYNQG